MGNPRSGGGGGGSGPGGEAGGGSGDGNRVRGVGKPRPGGSTGKPKKQSTAKRIRDIKRMLRQDTLPAKVREEKERQLEALERQRGDVQQSQLEAKMVTRYRKVKFFEKQKLGRRLAQLHKQLSDEAKASARAKLQQQVTQLQQDLAYIEQFPKTQPYISIVKAVSEMDPGTLKRRDDIRAQIAAGGGGAAAGAGTAAVPAGDDGGGAAIDGDDFFAPVSAVPGSVDAGGVGVGRLQFGEGGAAEESGEEAGEKAGAGAAAAAGGGEPTPKDKEKNKKNKKKSEKKKKKREAAPSDASAKKKKKKTQQ